VDSAINGLQVPGDPSTRYGGVRQSAHDLAIARGLSETEATFEAKQAASTAHLGVVQAAMSNNNPSYAQSYLNAHKDDMLAQDVLRVSGAIQQHVDTQSALIAVQQTTKELANAFQPTEFDRLAGIVGGMESRQRDYNADGTAVTSPVGAKYAMQVMPATAKNPGFGIQPAQDDSPGEYNRVGKQLLASLVNKYGNVPQALAAYNAGPGNVDKAIQDANKAGNPTMWLDKLAAYQSADNHSQTVNYVRNGVAQYSAGGGAPPIPTELEFTNSVVAKLGPNPSPEAVKIAQTAAISQYNILTKSIDEKNQAAVANAYRWADANGGRVSEMPSNLWSAVPPEKREAVRNYGKSTAKGDDTTNSAVYLKLSDDNYLKSLGPNGLYGLRPELSESDFQHFADRQGQLSSGPASNKAGDLPSSAINNVLSDRLRQMGLDPTPKDGTLDAMRVGAMRKVVDDSILHAQVAIGRMMTDVEVEKHIDGLFARSGTFRNTFAGYPIGRAKAMNYMGMEVSDIPPETLDNLKADFSKAGVANPTVGDLLGAYWHFRLGVPKP
jgi:soluble lytic murein transglycosylase